MQINDIQLVKRVGYGRLVQQLGGMKSCRLQAIT